MTEREIFTQYIYGMEKWGLEKPVRCIIYRANCGPVPYLVVYKFVKYHVESNLRNSENYERMF